MLTERAAEQVAKLLPEGAFVADIGCGQGPAMDWFKAHGFLTIGTSLSDEDIAVCRAKHLDVIKCDQMNLDPFASAIVDCVWARHVLEHSVCPLWSLTEFARVLRKQGILYVEVPMPRTSCKHETNPSHFSVMGEMMWASLIQRAGFDLIQAGPLNLTTPLGADQYYTFVARRV
jgi:ubiquinone/menaquinone biosynthesis C-methylase UbiE